MSVIIPALNEEGGIAGVVMGIEQALNEIVLDKVSILVVDNGSTDKTARCAADAGAEVINAPRRGYGSACLAGIEALPDATNIVLFLDGDGSDHPDDAKSILAPILDGQAELVIGSRILGAQAGWVEKGALTVPQHFGNWLATGLLRLGYGAHFTDLGPFRAVTAEGLRALKMDDQDFGWTVQMQIRAAKNNMTFQEVPVSYSCRKSGQSKVSGSLRGAVLAGFIILRTLAREYRFGSSKAKG